MEVRGKRVLVVGLARSGKEAARVLASRGATVTVTDSRPPSAFASEIRELSKQKVGMDLGRHREETFLAQDLIVVSPGVPWDMPFLVKARERGIAVVPEIEAASWYLQGPIVGITGSNGKTTTTALLGKMIKTSGFSTFVGGNIGVPLISAVDRTSPETILVTELSSFQLEAIRNFRPYVAVLLNLTPNHLDRHPSFEAYVAAKAQIFLNQTERDWAVLNADDPRVMNLAPTIKSRKIFFSRRRSLPDGVFVSNGHIRYRVANLERKLLETREVPLRGAFNVENVLAAATAACLVGADFKSLRTAVRDFPGVEHRLEFVRKVREVDFYNDSKATSVDATAKALTAFERGVHLILGGKDKGAPYLPLRPLLQGRVREVLLIGAAADRIESELKDVAVIVRAGDLETAVHEAFKNAVAGETVLLAPACASFDQFEDYEHRGRVFKKIVSEIARSVEAGGMAASFQIASQISPVPETDVHEVAEPPSSPMAAPEVSTAQGGPTEAAAGESLAAAPEEATINAPAEARPETPAVKPAAAPRDGPIQTAPHELTYIYEVAAEEIPSSESGQSMDYVEDAFQPPDAKELGALESVEDEPMIFEVPATGRGAADSNLSDGKPAAGSTVDQAPNGKQEKQG
jgi:UDP-N-acetylmuramoylalanine--D-glutamate ligase